MKALPYRDFSKSVIRTVQPSLAPVNSVKMALNCESDYLIGALVSRLGTDRVGAQMAAGKRSYGVFQHHEVAGNVLFGVYSDGTNNDIYLAATGAKSLEDDTKDLKTRFLTYLGATVRVNGTDACKSYTVAGGWITTGGAFDVADMPICDITIEWRDRVYIAGGAVGIGIIKYSSIADSATKTINWTVTSLSESAGQIEVEREDNGGEFKAFAKVPGYLLMFKQRTLKRWDGSSIYPEDLVKQGVYSQECVCSGKELAFFINQKGIWATNGGYPLRISKPIQDFIENIPGNAWGDVTLMCDEEHVYAYIGNITIENEEFANVTLKYNIGQESWDVYSYGHVLRMFGQYIDSNELTQVIVGDDNGQILQINTGYTDYGIPITYSIDTQDHEFGSRALKKTLNMVYILTKNISSGSVLVRINSHKQEDWNSIGSIKGDISEITDFKKEFNYLNLKITGITDSGRVTFLGYEFPKDSLEITDNVV